jgi:rhodanese-related sulfurtransferase
MPTHATPLEVTPADASSAGAGAVLLDVREDDEWAAGHAPGAVHLALSRLHPDRLPAADTYLVICRSGNRSGRVVAALTNAGFDARNVAGGMNAWAADGLPVVRSDGRPGTVS